jgi:site-specific recombinase XerD
VIGQSVGAIRMDRLKPTDIGAWTVWLRADRLASSSVSKAFNCLRMCLDDAVRDGLLARNPSRAVKQPRIVRTDARYLEAADVRRLLKELADSQYGSRPWSSRTGGRRS